MAFRFGGGSWSETIASITESRKYQTADISIFAPDSGPVEYDFETGLPIGDTEASALYSGQARVIGVRWGTFAQGDAQENSTSIKSVRVQIPKDALPRIEHGSYVLFVSTPGNPALESRVLTVTSDFQGASSATRTFECSLDSDSVTDG